MTRISTLGALFLILAPLAAAAEVAPSLRAEPVVRVDGTESRVPLVPRTVLVDPDGSLDPTEAARRLAAPDATVVTGVYSHGYITDVVWARIVVDVGPDAAGGWYLSLQLPNFDRLDVFVVPPGEGTPVPLYALGDRVPPQTDIRTRYHIAPLDLTAGRHVLLVRGRTTSTTTLALDLWKLDALLAAEQPIIGLQTFFLGIATVLFLAALTLFFYTRQIIYLIYMANLVAHCGVWLMINGTGPGILWPGFATRHHFELHTFVALSASSTYAFAAVFLSTSRVPRYVGLILKAGAALAAIIAVACLIVPDAYATLLNSATSQVVLPLLAILAGATAVGLYRGEPAARPLMLTWMGFIVAVVVAILRDAGVVPNNVVTLSGPQLGSVFEMVVFAYMLLDRLGRLQQEKEHLQHAALTAAREQEAVLERRVAERTAELDAANVRLRAIVQSAPFPIALTREADGRIIFANQRACDLVGAPLDAVIGRESSDWFVDPSRRAALLASLDADGRIEDQEIELRRADGTPFWALTSMVRLTYDGELVRLAALNDITRIKTLEQDLRQTADLEAAAAARERAARRLQQQFVAMISHEFRTPLAIIDGAAQNFSAQAERDRGRLQKIRSSVTRLLRMIDTCLIDERVDGGAIVLHRETFDLRELVEDAVDITRAMVPDRPIVLDLPPLPAPLSADLRLAEIVLNNLLENAVKYSPAGSAVMAMVALRTDAVELSVTDEGPGVPAADRERIFEKYYRAPNTTGTAGAGLGLHLVRAIVEAHGGTVRCLPGISGGSRFVVRLPAAAADSIGAAPASAMVAS